jgi:carboxymethylenebutenolidase
MTDTVTQLEIDQRVFDLYDEYCHGHIDRREFLRRAALVAGGLAMAHALLPRYAQAQTISFTDTRIKAQYVTYPSPGGSSGQMRGYLVRPAGPGPFPAVLVIHENRGLNPYIEDVARRAAVEGFVALAPDGLSPVGGYPGNDDDGRTLQGNLDQTANRHAQGAAADPVRRDRPAHHEMWPAFEAALKTAGVPYQMYTYPGTQHGFHNNSTPRYHEASAKLAWDRTIAFFKKNLA